MDMSKQEPTIPLPGETWKILWNFSQHYLSNDERKHVDKTWHAVQNALEELTSLYPELINNKYANEEVKQFAEEMMEVEKQLVPILHKLTEMLDDPYEVEKRQLKKRGS